MPQDSVVIETIQLSTISDVFAIILSIVALIITVMGFFASLKFYRDGVELQKSANSALAKIEEKTSHLQAHLVGMFDKTLDAAISPSGEVDKSFDDLDEFIEKFKTEAVELVKAAQGESDNKNQSEIKSFITEKLSDLEGKISETREIAETSISDHFPPSTSKNKRKSPLQFILDELESGPKSIGELSQLESGPRYSFSSISNSLRKLEANGIVERLENIGSSETGRSRRIWALVK